MKSYQYEYDALNRITSAFDNTGNYNLEQVRYDKNGNILSLKRNGHLNEQASDFGQMDNLQYVYNGNQLTSVQDLSGIDFGFKDGKCVKECSINYYLDKTGKICKNCGK